MRYNDPMRARRRRFLHAATFAGTASHHGFELGKGVGLVLQPELGLVGASAFWTAVLGASIGVSLRGSSRWDKALSFGIGANVGAAMIHFILWPWELRNGVPVLTEAEGLPEEDLKAYNTLLNAWGLIGIATILAEVPSGARRYAIAGCLATLPLQKHARYHFRWLERQAQENPAWWNRALQGNGSRARSAIPLLFSLRESRVSRSA